MPLVTSRRERRTHVDFVELAEVHGFKAVNGWPDVLAVRALLHHLQLANTGHVGQPGLDLCHVWDLEDQDQHQDKGQGQAESGAGSESRGRTRNITGNQKQGAETRTRNMTQETVSEGQGNKNK